MTHIIDPGNHDSGGWGYPAYSTLCAGIGRAIIDEVVPLNFQFLIVVIGFIIYIASFFSKNKFLAVNAATKRP